MGRRHYRKPIVFHPLSHSPLTSQSEQDTYGSHLGHILFALLRLKREAAGGVERADSSLILSYITLSMRRGASDERGQLVSRPRVSPCNTLSHCMATPPFPTVPWCCLPPQAVLPQTYSTQRLYQYCYRRGVAERGAVPSGSAACLATLLALAAQQPAVPLDAAAEGHRDRVQDRTTGGWARPSGQKGNPESVLMPCSRAQPAQPWPLARGDWRGGEE